MMDADFRIGRFLINPRAATLEASGCTTRIDRVAMSVLVLLARHAGREVSRVEIFEVVWEGRAVSDETLTGAISTLRKSLGDDAKRPTYIETLPKYGYRLIAPVTPISREPVSPTSEVFQKTARPAALAVAAGVVAVSSVLWFSGEESGAPPMPSSPEAYDAYLEASYLLSEGENEAIVRSLERFEMTIHYEPEFARAHSGMAEAYLTLGRRGEVTAQKAMAETRAALARAFDAGDDGARAHALQAMSLYSFEWDFEGAESAFRRALKKDPTDAHIRRWYAEFLTTVGRFDEALAQPDRIRELDPTAYSRPSIAAILNMARRHDRALVALKEQLALKPDSPDLRFELARTYFHLGEEALALAEMERLDLGCVSPEQLRQFVEANGGLDGLCRLQLAWLEGRRNAGASPPAMAYAQAYAGLGDMESTFQWLERAWEQREPGLPAIAVDPKFDRVRDDPRFAELINRIGLPLLPDSGIF